VNRKDVLSGLRLLELPPDQYVVVGGAALAVREIRDTNDIDLVVTPSLFDQLNRAGWVLKVRPNGKPGLHRGCVEAYLDVNCGACERSTSWLFSNSEILEGIRFVDLETLAAFKASYGREKDRRDLDLIAKRLCRRF
jgi:hypothetical protein